MKILLLAGGWSSERDVSLNGAREIEKALRRMGHQTSLLDPLSDLAKLAGGAGDMDFIFINMHGSPGEDGLIQAMIEKIPAPYNGSDSAASLIALNKFVTKIYYRKAGLRVCPEAFITYTQREKTKPAISFPAIMKGNVSGSSADLFRIETEAELEKAVNASVRGGRDEFIVEPMIDGMDVTCPVFGNVGQRPEPMPAILIRPASGGIFDYHAKYSDGGADEICPAPLDENLTWEIQKMAATAHEVLGLSGFSRSDFMVDREGTPFILETNTLPGMTPNSLLPKSAKAIGMTFEDLLEKIINLGLEKFDSIHKR